MEIENPRHMSMSVDKDPDNGKTLVEVWISKDQINKDKFGLDQHEADVVLKFDLIGFGKFLQAVLGMAVQSGLPVHPHAQVLAKQLLEQHLKPKTLGKPTDKKAR